MDLYGDVSRSGAEPAAGPVSSLDPESRESSCAGFLDTCARTYSHPYAKIRSATSGHPRCASRDEAGLRWLRSREQVGSRRGLTVLSPRALAFVSVATAFRPGQKTIVSVSVDALVSMVPVNLADRAKPE